MADLEVWANERVVLVGKTGSGKTFLARWLLRPIRRLIVLDPKSTLGGPEWNLEDWNQETVKKMIDGENGRLRVKAPLDGNWEPYLQVAYNMTNVLVYIDEVYGVVDPGSKPPKMLTALYTRGRELNIGVWAATQRPAWVPLFCLSEVEWMFVFKLQMENDRKKVAEIGGPQLLEPVSDSYGFWVYNTMWDYPEYSTGLAVEQSTRRVARV